MTDRAHPAAMNESSLWQAYQKDRIATQHLGKVMLSTTRSDDRGTVTTQTWEASPAELADNDLEEFRKRYPHRVHDDRPK